MAHRPRYVLLETQMGSHTILDIDENPAKIVALVPAPQQPPAESMTPEIIEKIRREGFEKANELIEILNREQEVREACNSAAKPGDKQ